jgi:iron-sulfur cluster assembly accessory protein
MAKRMAPRIVVAMRKQSMMQRAIPLTSCPPQLQQRTMVMVTKTSATTPRVETSTTPLVTSNDTPTNTNLSIQTKDLNITENCTRRIEALAHKRKESLNEIYLRVYVDAGGCSGFQYKFEMTCDQDEQVDPEEDVVFSASNGARVVVDAASLELIQGSTIDFVQEMIKSAFCVVDNPKSESACGCGSSFAIKNFQVNPALD